MKVQSKNKTGGRKPSLNKTKKPFGRKGVKMGKKVLNNKPKRNSFKKTKTMKKGKKSMATEKLSDETMRFIIKSKRLDKLKQRKPAEDIELRNEIEKDYENAKEFLKVYKEQRKENVKKVLKSKVLVEEDVVLQALTAVRNVESKNVKKEKLDITSIEDEPLFLQVTFVKVYTPHKNKDADVKKKITVKLPNNPHPPDSEVLLIMQDTGPDVDITLNIFKEKLASAKATKMISEVLTVKQLKTEYMAYEARKNLATRFDVVLVEERAMYNIDKLLGKHFIKRKKYPVSCRIKTPRMKVEIRKSLQTIPVVFGSGNCVSMKVGHTKQTDFQISTNILQAVKKLALGCPGGWDNIQNLCVKRRQSAAIPFYVNLNPINKVVDVMREPSKMMKKDVVKGNITTVGEWGVEVFPDGNVFKIPRVYDPEEIRAHKEWKAKQRAEIEAKKKASVDAKKKANPNKQTNKKLRQLEFEAKKRAAAEERKEAKRQAEERKEVERMVKEGEGLGVDDMMEELDSGEEEGEEEEEEEEEGKEEHWLVALEKDKLKRKKEAKLKMSDEDNKLEGIDIDVDFNDENETCINLHEAAYLDRLKHKMQNEKMFHKNKGDVWADDSDSNMDSDVSDD